MRRSGGGTAQHDLLVQRAIPEAPVQREHAHEPRLVGRAERRDAVRLRPRELAALDRAGDAASSVGACDAREPVPPRLVLEAEEAVAEDAAVLEREEVRLLAGAGRGPRAAMRRGCRAGARNARAGRDTTRARSRRPSPRGPGVRRASRARTPARPGRRRPRCRAPRSRSAAPPRSRAPRGIRPPRASRRSSRPRAPVCRSPLPRPKPRATAHRRSRGTRPPPTGAARARGSA